MTNITDAQRELLAKAATGPQGVIDAPEDAKLAKALIKKGLAIALPVEGGASRLIITEAGRTAIAADREEMPPAADGDAVVGATGELPTAGSGVARMTLTRSGSLALSTRPKRPPDAAQAAAPPAPPAAAGKPKKDTPSGKLGTLVALLKRPEGATLEAMRAATGWQAHSVRGAMSGSLKKGFGFAISSEKTDAGRIYRITATEAA